jgi:hypothetical protein
MQAEIALREGYEGQLVTALDACTASRSRGHELSDDAPLTRGSPTFPTTAITCTSRRAAGSACALHHCRKSVDLRAKMPPVFDQGQLGSCTANALSGAMGFLHPGLIGSRLFIYYNERAMEGTVDQDAGAQIRDGVKTLNKIGVCPEREWPYKVTKFKTKPPAPCFADRGAAHDHGVPARHGARRDAALPGRRLPLRLRLHRVRRLRERRGRQDRHPQPAAKGEKNLGGHAVMCRGLRPHQRAPAGAQLVGQGLGHRRALHHALRVRGEQEPVRRLLDAAQVSLQPHQQRVVAEQKDLADKIAKLTTFTNGAMWGQITLAERQRLRRQLTAMEQYDAVLLERIGAFEA